MRSIFYAPLSLALARRKATPFCAAETASLPILILTARGEPSERVKGLELGADDYLVKPFSMRELILRIQALLLRSRSGPHERLDAWPVFVLGGIYVGIEETLEDSLCAELVEHAHHGMAFGVLGTVNAIGDFVSSAIVGLLWSVAGTTGALGYSAALFFTAAVLVVRLRAGGDFPSRIA